MVSGKSFSKLGLPAQRRPAIAAKPPARGPLPNIQPYAASIYELVAAEMERVGKDAANAAVFAAVMDRLGADEALFRRLATTLLHKEVIRRIKRIRRRAVAQEMAKGGDFIGGETKSAIVTTKRE